MLSGENIKGYLYSRKQESPGCTRGRGLQPRWNVESTEKSVRANWGRGSGSLEPRSPSRKNEPRPRADREEVQLDIKLRKTFYFLVVKEQVWKQSPFTKLAEILPKLTLGAVGRCLAPAGGLCVRRAPGNPFKGNRVRGDAYDVYKVGNWSPLFCAGRVVPCGASRPGGS